MKKLAAITLGVILAANSVFAAFSVNSSTKTIALDSLKPDFRDFKFTWRGYDSQDVTFTIETTSGTGYDMTGYLASFKATKQTTGGSETTYISVDTSDTTVSTSNITFSVAYTNVPPNGVYKAELFLQDASTPTETRSLGRGTIKVEQSLYANDGSDFTFPSLTSTLADLADVILTSVSQGDVLYRGASAWNNLAAGTSGYVLTTAGASANPSWTAKTTDTDTHFTNYLAVSGGVLSLSGAARSGSNTITLASDAYDGRYYTETETDAAILAATTSVYAASATGWAAADLAATSAVYTASVTASSNSAASIYVPASGGTFTGGLTLNNADVTLGNGVDIVNASGAFNLESQGALGLDSATGYIFFKQTNDLGLTWFVDVIQEQLVAMLDDDTGNQLVIGNIAAIGQDYDHAAQTDPTLFIHSDTSPASDNTQWLSLTHDKTDGVLDTGTGHIKIDDALTVSGVQTNAGNIVQTSGNITAAGNVSIPLGSRFQNADGGEYIDLADNLIYIGVNSAGRVRIASANMYSEDSDGWILNHYGGPGDPVYTGGKELDTGISMGSVGGGVAGTIYMISGGTDMGLWTANGLTITNTPNDATHGFSVWDVNGDENFVVTGEGAIRPGVGTSFPASPGAGDIYYHSTSNKHFGYNGSSWNALY